MKKITACLSLLALSATSHTYAGSTVAPDADIIYLQKSCANASGGFIENCFTTSASATSWLWGGSGRSVAPSLSDKVVIRVGPGDFQQLTCRDAGFISVEGSGRDQTRFVDDSTGVQSTAIKLHNCESLSFSHLSAQSCVGVQFTGTGNSTWSNVDMIGNKPGNCIISAGWLDNDSENFNFGAISASPSLSEHFFFGSRAIAKDGNAINTSAFIGYNALSWFYGGDIQTTIDGHVNGQNRALLINAPGDVRVFGSTIRNTVAATSKNGNSVAVGVEVLSGQLHMHGGIINSSANQSSVDIDSIALLLLNGGAHTPDTAFVVRPSTNGNAARVWAAPGASLNSPFLWQASSVAPPASGSAGPYPGAYNATDGQDLFVDLDAGPSGGENHLMVHDKGCTGTGGPWRDMTTGNCRS